MLGSVPQWHFDLPAHPRLYTQNITINLPASHWKLQVIPRVSPNLMRDQRQWKMFVMANRATLPRAVPIPHLNQYPSITKDDQVYDAQLQPGVNVIEVQIAAAIEKKKRTPGGPEIEVERYQINVNLMKS